VLRREVTLMTLRDRSRQRSNTYGRQRLHRRLGPWPPRAGSNYFHYVRDPRGSCCEYSSDVDYIPADHDWKSGDHPPEDSFYVWGPTPPADFAFNHEVTV
jgi:hypothetical protein